MTPLLPAHAFGMMLPMVSPFAPVIVGGMMMRKVARERRDAITASQPSFSTNLYVMAMTTMSARTLNVPPATALSGAVHPSPNTPAINAAYPGIGRFAIRMNADPQMVNGVVIMNASRSAATARSCENSPMISMNLSKSSCFPIVFSFQHCIATN